MGLTKSGGRDSTWPPFGKGCSCPCTCPRRERSTAAQGQDFSPGCLQGCFSSNTAVPERLHIHIGDSEGPRISWGSAAGGLVELFSLPVCFVEWNIAVFLGLYPQQNVNCVFYSFSFFTFLFFLSPSLSLSLFYTVTCSRWNKNIRHNKLPLS